jgi:hypothetical protein
MWKTSGIWLATTLVMAAGDLSEKPHPRLWFPKSSEAALREKLAKDPLAAKLHASVMAEAEKILKERPCRYEIPDGLRLLGESRRALKNVTHTAWAWRMGGGEKFRVRTIAELEAACAMKDWNPKHFLDVAEMATAVATGYDWLYQTLTPEQRTMCERAIIDKALKPAKGVYDKGNGWSRPGNNWSQVCGAGIALAAAAIAGNDEGLSENLFEKGLKLVEGCGRFYQPDGMYPEGPGYWQYGTNFHVMMLAACQPLGRPITDDPIMRMAGESIMHLTSPTRYSYNFADCGTNRETPSPAQCWLAMQYKDAAQAGYVRSSLARAMDEAKGPIKGDRYFPLAVLWLPEAPADAKPLPKAAVFHGEQPVALFRTGWDSKAAWFAIKGGTAAASHGHMDVGSFCYDAHGTRWIHDMGSENYNLPGYFGGKRWDYYRLQNRSHNTLEIGGKLQNPKSKPCALVSSAITGNPFAAAFDLTGSYAGSASKVVRSARFDSVKGTVRIEDEITAPAGDIVWRAFTDADAEVKGDSVILRKKEGQITLRRVSEAGTWTITAAKPPTAEENQNKNFRAIVLTVPKAEKLTLAVEIRP